MDTDNTKHGDYHQQIGPCSFVLPEWQGRRSKEGANLQSTLLPRCLYHNFTPILHCFGGVRILDDSSQYKQTLTSTGFVQDKPVFYVRVKAESQHVC